MTKVTLKPLNRGPRDNRYCGPAVVSFVTGMNTSEAAALMRDTYGRRSIRGACFAEVADALYFGGYTCTLIDRYSSGMQPTLAGWLKDNVTIRSAGRVFLVQTTTHWQLVSGRRYACGKIGDIVSVRDERVPRRARVCFVWEIHRRAR